MARITKVMRYQIIKPVGDNWNTLGEVLRTIQRETRTALNKTIQLAWEWQNFSSDYKDQHGTYPKPRDILEKKKGGTVGSLAHYAYDRLKIECSRINTQNLIQTIKRADENWKADVKDILRGEKSIPVFKKDCPVYVVSQAFSIRKEPKGYVMQTSLMSRACTQELGRDYGYFSLLLGVGDKTQQTIIDRIISEQYKAGVSQILNIKGKWFVNLTYSFEKEDAALDRDNIMGLDLGIVNPVYMAFNHSLHRYKIEGGEIDRFRKQVERRRNQLLGQGKYCGDGRKGHGRKARIRPIEVTSEKIANFRDACNHKYSRFVVDMAIKHGCGTIQMEDLSGISGRDTFLKKWPYYDLQQKIEYKANEAGITVVYIKPSYTSQRCSKCGHIEKENRLTQSEFSCRLCGFETLADFNAARNIAIKDIEKLIEQALTEQ